MFFIHGLQIWKRGIKSQKDAKIEKIWKGLAQDALNVQRALNANTGTHAKLAMQA